MPVEVVVISASMRGSTALQRIIPQLPPDFPLPILHSPTYAPVFPGSLAERLNEMSRIRVVEGSDGEEIAPGKAIVTSGGI